MRFYYYKCLHEMIRKNIMIVRCLNIENFRNIEKINITLKEIQEKVGFKSIYFNNASSLYEPSEFPYCKDSDIEILTHFGKRVNQLINSKVSSFDDLVSALAVYRPGANNTIKEYIDCKLGRKPITYFHKDLEPILKDTYGFVIYEEQIMRIALKFAGYSLNQADYLRAQAKKKNKEVIIKERSNFVNSCIKNGYSEEIGNSIYDYFVKFADFGFNQAHAVAYGRLSYLVAYLKCLYPEYFYAITMKELSGSKLYASILQAKKLGVKIYPPRINESAYSHVVYPKSILLGFSSLHDVLKSDIDKIIEERNTNGKYRDYVWNST